MFLSIVIAVYNEEENIRELTERIRKSLGRLKLPFELIYVVDGTDKTYDILKGIKKSMKNLIIDYSSSPRGFRNSFMKGFSLVSRRATHILTLDGDLNHQPEEIGDFIKAMDESKADLVIGSRYISKGKIKNLALWKRLLSLVANLVIRLFWGIKIKDKTSGYRLYKRAVVDRITPKCKANNFEFLFEILILAQKAGYEIIEIPIIFKARIYGESKFQMWKVIKGYLRLMVRR